MRTTGPRRFVTVLALLLVIVTAPSAPSMIDAAHADGGDETEFVSAINEARTGAGLGELAESAELTRIARRHSRAMAAADVLHHDPALDAVVDDWRRLGENVGRGPGVDVIHTAFMDSPTHAENVLEPGYDEVGVGVAVVDGQLWVTEVFRTR